MENVKILAELIEHSGQVCKLFIDSEVALNDGDTEKSVKCNKDGQQLFSTMMNDIFKEAEEIFETKTSDTLDYDYPSVLELSKNLSELMYNVGRYIPLVIDNDNSSVREIIEKKILLNMNTAVEIFNCIFNN